MFGSRCVRTAVMCLLVCVIVALGFAQKQTGQLPDAIAKVPALDSFHEVIYQIWHEAWPNKNTALLQKLQPEVEKGIASVAAAQLPKILHEKKATWEENVKKLQTIGLEYKTAAGANDSSRLMDAAEKLHGQFEALIRSIRPALGEIDDFHSVLYMLVHHYLPAYDFQNIKSSSAELKQKMSSLNSAKLPERFKQKESEFVAAREKLSQSVDSLEAAVVSGDKKKVEDAVSVLHSNYMALDNIFGR